MHFPPISAFQRNVLAGTHSGVETYHMVILTLQRSALTKHARAAQARKIAAMLSPKDAESSKLSLKNSVPRKSLKTTSDLKSADQSDRCIDAT